MKVKVMVGGGRRSIRAPAKLGPGEMNAGVNEGVDGGRAAEMQRDEGWNQCREPHVTCDLIALRTASRDVEGCRWKVRRAAEMRRDERWNRYRKPRMSCDLRASKSAVLDVDGRRRMAGSVANMQRDECEKPMSGTACVVQPECMDGGNLLQPEERNPSGEMQRDENWNR